MTDQPELTPFRLRPGGLTPRQKVQAMNNMHEILKSQQPGSTETLQEAIQRVLGKTPPGEKDEGSETTFQR